MFQNIVLCGGTTMIKGFSKRIYSQLPFFLENTTTNSLTISDEIHKDLATWIGGSMIASMSTFNKLLINKENLAEIGEERIGTNIFKKII